MWSGALLNGYHTLDDALEALGAALADSIAEPALTSARRIATLRDDLQRIVDPDDRNISWVSRQGGALSVSTSPVDVSAMLHERLLNLGHPVVLPSASLSTGGDFQFIRTRLGLDEPIVAPLDELTVRSAIDHRSQALLFLPRDLPAVDDPRFAPAAARTIVALAASAHGGGFVLCTSLRSMHALAREFELLRASPMLRGSAPKAALLERFRSAGDAMLVATMSFWEGVDVPGSARSFVVIDRIPFPVPSDPLHAARSRAIERRGHLTIERQRRINEPLY